jgi:hypothetical protein
MAQRHAPLVLGCRGFRDHCQHYRQNHVHGDVDPTNGALHVQSDPAFHYCSEFWYPNADALIRGYHDTDYFEVLRPDVQLWSDPAARLAFMAEEAWFLGLSQPPAGDGACKLLVLHTAVRGQVQNAGPPREHYPGFFDFCLRASCNRVSGQMDFARATARAQVDLPFHAISELWFESSRSAQDALLCADGRRLVREAGWLPARTGEGSILWATEVAVF